MDTGLKPTYNWVKMTLFNGNSKCDCTKIRNSLPGYSIKKYLAVFSLLLAVILVIPSAKAQFFGSGEQYIRDLYKTYLGRAPDQNAINYYLYVIENGGSYESIKTEVENSKEAKQYLLTSGPRIVSFNAQRINKNNNTWSFLWSTVKADQVSIKFQCVAGVKIFVADNTTVNNTSDKNFTCDEDHKTSPNSGASFSFRNTTGRGLIVSARLYPISNNFVYLNAAKTISFYIDKSAMPTAPLTPDYQAGKVKSTPVSVVNSPKVSFQPVVTGLVQNTQVTKTVSIDSVIVSDSVTLGKNAKRVSWKVSKADSVSLSLSCPAKVSVTLVTKSGAKKPFTCNGVGQKFNANDSADFIFNNTSKAVATVDLEIDPIVNNSIVSGGIVKRSINLAK